MSPARRASCSFVRVCALKTPAASMSARTGSARTASTLDRTPRFRRMRTFHSLASCQVAVGAHEATAGTGDEAFFGRIGEVIDRRGGGVHPFSPTARDRAAERRRPRPAWRVKLGHATFLWVTRWAAVVLAGGRARRFGRDKTRAVLGSDSLLARALAAVPRELPCVIVGPVRPLPERAEVTWVLEEPRFAGPVAALRSGLAVLPEGVDGVLLLAADQPFAAEAVAALFTAWPDAPTCEALVALDESGRRQPLLALYALGPLRARLEAPAGPAESPPVDASMRSVLAGLRVREHRIPPGSAFDVDTEADLDAA